MIVEPLELPEVLLLKPRVFRDGRGHFLETWHDVRYAAAGLPASFRQDNVSVSRRDVLRGLHFQHPNGQGKLVTALSGSVFDVAVDVRRGSATFGRWIGRELSGDTGFQLWVPPGFAHGFVVLSEFAVFAYKCSTNYSPESERSVLWNDPGIGIEWPVVTPLLSEKDERAPRLNECSPELLPSLTSARGD